MQNTVDFVAAPRPRVAKSDDLTRSRTAQAFVLTAIAVAIGAGLVVAFGPIAIPFYLIGLPVPLVLLWSSTDVTRADERRA